MSNLHVFFALRNERAFAHALEGSRGKGSSQPSNSGSGGRSWTRHGSHVPTIDVNARDWLGRTVLHLACATAEPFALAYVRHLLDNPAINVNAQDTESHWTALHRAFYVGNLAAAILLLQCTETDTQLRDYDGYTPFDLYNSTVDGTALDPVPEGHDEDICADLFTWGVNRNAALGHGDAADRTYPDQVVIQPPTPYSSTSQARFKPIRVNGISMAKLHTTVITDETRGNLRVCGFGNGGRLGTGKHTQYSLQPVSHLTTRVTAVALGQDHTLALTTTGEVLSWGLNRFSQLGYIVEREEPVQTIARRVLGPLRKERAVGVAACRSASACWTSADVFTWGRNNGQLGYDCTAQSVQVLPRKVTGVQGVKELALTDSAMVCLLKNGDVICFRADAHFRVKFPASDLADLSPYQHPHVVKSAIIKITCTDGSFAALSSRGDVFTFPAPPPSGETDPRPPIRPQRVWAFRKSFDPAKDVALGADSALIICTQSGHVYVRPRPGTKALRIPFLHHVVRVCASSTGAFAALRCIPSPLPLHIVGASLAEDLRSVRPWISGGEDASTFVHDFFPSLSECSHTGPPTILAGDEDEEDGGALDVDVAAIIRLCALLSHRDVLVAHGADVIVCAGVDIPVHRTILAARLPSLRPLFEGKTETVGVGAVKVTYSPEDVDHPRLIVSSCHPMSILLLLEYLYTDYIPSLWDRRVGESCSALLGRLGILPGVVKENLEALACALELPEVSAVLAAPSKRVPTPSLARDMAKLFREPTGVSPSDIVLELADRPVKCHSVVLRARSPFFRAFFDDADWTSRRWSAGGVLKVNMHHMEWKSVKFMMAWMYWGEEDELFEHLEDVQSIAELLDLVFAVLAVASELLLDRLMLICSSVILRHVTLQNAVSLLADATYYNALELVRGIQGYIAGNLEALLEAHLLDDAHPDLIQALSAFVQTQQTAKAPVTRTNLIVDAALHACESWLALQDIPQPLLRSQRSLHDSSRLSPAGFDKIGCRAPPPPISSLSSPALLTKAKPSSPKSPYGDEVFSMEEDSVPALNVGRPPALPVGSIQPAAWKPRSAQVLGRVDMKSIITEAEMAKTTCGTSSGMRVVCPNAAEQMDITPKRSPRSSQRERRTLQAQTSQGSMEPVIHPSVLGSPWKHPGHQAVTAASPAFVSMKGPLVRPQSSNAGQIVGSCKTPSPMTISKQHPATPGSVFQMSNPSLVFSPYATQRRSLPGSPAWTTAPILDQTSSVFGLSFAQIQQQQRDQGQQPKGKRSLLEIQQEERARQEEEDFLRWWTAEEERLKVEAESQIPQEVPTDRDAAKHVPINRRGRKSTRARHGSTQGKVL